MNNRLIVHGLMKINDKYLLIKRTEFKRGEKNMFPLYWDIPGGLVEKNELPREALIRECNEEVGLNVTINKIIHEDSNIDLNKDCVYTRLVYLCDVINQSEKDIVLQLEEHSEYKLIENLKTLENELIAPFVREILEMKKYKK